MIPGADTRLRLIFPKPENAPDGIGLLPGAPPRHEGAREHRVAEIDPNRVVDDAAQA
jgi:hypothetical protein